MKNDIYIDRESKDLELKETIPNKNQIIKTCVAFANGSGGEIVIGIEDKTNLIIGVSTRERDKIFDQLSNSIFDSISPPILPEIYERNINDKMIIIIKIYPGIRPPYFVRSEGSKQGIYLRIGTSTRRASEEYIEELYRHQKKIFYDEESAGVEYTYLQDDLLRKIYGKQYSDSKLLMDKVLIRDEAQPKKMMCTKAGVLFFNENPEQFISEAIVICTEFKGQSGREILKTIELTGAIPTLAENTIKLISSWIERDYKVKKSGKLEGRYLLPLEALREGVINALVHRKYFIPGAIKIALYEDRLEIFSPGGFPGLISPANIGDGTTFLRNPTIAKLARKHKLIEKLGSGARLILDSCKSVNLKKPTFNEDGDFVKLTYYFEKELDDRLSIEQQIIQMGQEQGELKMQEITGRLKISRNTATRKMNQLISQGVCERKGKGPSVYFKFIKLIAF